MLHFRMTMPLYLMMIYGSILLLIVLFLRILLKKRLPGYVFPILWGLVVIRFLVPYSLSSPLSVKMPLYPSRLMTQVSYATAAVSSAYETNDGVDADAGAASPAVEDASAADIQVTSPDAVHSASEDAESSLIENIAEDAADITVSYAGPSTFGFSAFQNADSLLSLYESRFTHFLHPAVYLLGLAVTACILFLQKYRYVRKLKDHILIEHNEVINSILREMNMAHVLVFSNDEIASPLVCGLLAPRIYLPTRMDFQNKELLRHILAHETMHIRRRDNWIKAAMLAVLCLNWFNPLVWLMARCLASDLETACDEAVLRTCQDEDTRKSYAYSLLAMAVSASRSPLLYSAFSRTEVEKRIQRVLRYKKTSALMLFAVLLLLTGSTVVFATGGQAPFDSCLSSTCYYGKSDSRWACKVSITRDIALGDNPGKRADDTILAVLEADAANDPDLISERIREALSEEFHVEKNAFAPDCTLCLDEETEREEYASWELARNEQGIFLYQGKPVHSFTDEMNRIYQSCMDGTLDIAVQRNRLGYISSVTAFEDGVVVRLASAPAEDASPSSTPPGQ